MRCTDSVKPWTCSKVIVPLDLSVILQSLIFLFRCFGITSNVDKILKCAVHRRGNTLGQVIQMSLEFLTGTHMVPRSISEVMLRWVQKCMKSTHKHTFKRMKYGPSEVTFGRRATKYYNSRKSSC